MDQANLIDKLLVLFTDLILHSPLSNRKLEYMLADHFVKLLLFRLGRELFVVSVELGHDDGFERSEMSQRLFI